MKVLVAGATGFIGRHLCSSLIGDGHQVSALSRNAESAGHQLPGIHSVHKWNPSVEALPEDALEGKDSVVNLVGESVSGLWTSGKRRSIYDSRVKSTVNIISALERASVKPKVLLSASAVGFYGDRGEEIITESSSPGSGFLSDLCVSWENEALRAEALGVRVVLLRIGFVLGRDGGMLPALLPMARLGLSGALGSGRQWWPWIHIGDVTGMARFALANEIEGPINVTAPNPVRQKEFIRTLGRLLGRPSFLRTPSFLLNLVGGVAADSLNSMRALPNRLKQSGYGHLYSDLLTALSDLTGQP